MPHLPRRALLAGLTALPFAAPALAAPFNRARIGDAPITIERGFATVGYGQLHYRRAAPQDLRALSGADPVVLFHQTPNSSQVFVEFMAELARDRIVYAVDTPGLGASDVPAEPPEISDYATAMAQFLDVMSLSRVDVLGYHTGASIAAELANMVPNRIDGLMLVGLALFTQEERDGFFAQPWPRPIAKDGSHLQPEWQSTFRWQGPGMSDASVIRSFIAKISAGETGWWGARAVMRHDLETPLKNAAPPMLFVNMKDDLWEITPRARAIRPDVEILHFPDYGFGVFDVIETELAAIARRHFDASRPLAE